MKYNFSVNIYQAYNPIVIGKILSSYGFRGWLKIFTYTNKPKNIFNYNPIFIKYKHNFYKIYIESYKFHIKQYLIKLKDINQKEDAYLFHNKELFTETSSFPLLKNNEYYLKDIIDCSVFNMDNIFLGKVVKILDTYSYNILVVKLKKEIFIPFILNKIIKIVDIINRVLKINWK